MMETKNCLFFDYIDNSCYEEYINNENDKEYDQTEHKYIIERYVASRYSIKQRKYIKGYWIKHSIRYTRKRLEQACSVWYQYGDVVKVRRIDE